MIATESGSWWPFIILLVVGLPWTVCCILVAQRYEKHDAPLSYAVIPVLLGQLALVCVVESIW